MDKKLRFSLHNKKINKLAVSLGYRKNQAVGFDLPAGHTCPAADQCQSFANRESGKITDGDNCKFRCYAASTESAFSAARRARWANYEILRKLTSDEMVKVILSSLPVDVKIVRVHSSGDFFSKRYFQAWVKVAEIRTDVQFFGYTKVLPYVQYLNNHNLKNFHLTYSYGGKMDSKLTCEPTCYVVKNVAEAMVKKLIVACVDNPADDFCYIMSGRTFALVLHGTQPAKKRQTSQIG